MILLSYPRNLVPLGEREQAWPRIVVALGDVLKGKMPVVVLSYLSFARWDGDIGHCSPYLHAALFQGAAHCVALWELGY